MKSRNFKNTKRFTSLLLASTLVLSVVDFGSMKFVKAVDTQFAGEEWYDQISTIEVNRESARSTFTPYETIEKALKHEKSALDNLDEQVQSGIKA